MRVFQRGDTGRAVADIIHALRTLRLIAIDGTGDRFTGDVEQAVRAFQQNRGLVADGVVDAATYRALKSAMLHLGSRPLALWASTPQYGDDVLELQNRLTRLGYDAGRPDGTFGRRTERAVRDFQRDCGLPVDGICGAGTVRALRRMSPRVGGGRPVLLREQESLRRNGKRLGGKRIVIDPGHGGADPGVQAGGQCEADLVWDLARRLEGRMIAIGMNVLLSRGALQNPTDAERARFANETGADLVLSLHIDGNESRHANGIATFHYGTGDGTTSTVGEQLAGFVQRELVARTGLRDCRTHATTLELLTRTQCPAVRVEIGYLTSPVDRARLLDPTFRDVVTEGVLVAVKRLHLVDQGGQPATGTFTFADIVRHEHA